MNTWAIFDTKNEKGGGGSVKRDPRSCCQKKWAQKDKRGIIYHRKEILKMENSLVGRNKHSQSLK